MSNSAIIERTQQFVADAFQKNPSFSFNDWQVMYQHCVTVKELALQIAETVKCNTLAVALGALLHDIGKTYDADHDTLHTNHEDFNLTVSETFLSTLGLSDEDFALVKALITYTSDGTEMKVVKDADAIALYKDKRLHMLFIEWALNNNFGWAIQRKIDKFGKLNYPISRELGEPWLRQMEHDWDEYQSSRA